MADRLIILESPAKANTLMVFALDDTLPLENKYWLNDFIHAAKGHILAKAQIDLPSHS